MPGRPLRVLVVAPFLPVPPTDGQRVRTWNLTKRLAARHEVILATWVPPGTDTALVAPVVEAVRHVVLGTMGHARIDLGSRSRRWLQFGISGRPPYVAAMREERRRGIPTIARAIAELHHSRPFDLVVLEEESLCLLGLPRPAIPTVLHRLNVFSKAVLDVPSRSALRTALRPLERPLWQRFDRLCSRAADVTIATTAESAAELQRLVPERPVRVVPNGVDIPPVPSTPSEGTDLVFVGWMSYVPNVDAVCWFAEKVWPTIRSQAPGTRLRIVGRHPAKAVLALERDDVIVTGEVPDVSRACQGARAAFATLRAGMGIKNKTLEAMALGLPVLATPAGAEGIPAGERHGLFVSEDPAALARWALDLLADGRRAEHLGARARAFVEEHFAWDAVADGYAAVLEEAVGSTWRG